MLFKRFLWIAVVLIVLPSVSRADTVIYKSKNKLDFIKLDGAKKKEIEGTPAQEQKESAGLDVVLFKFHVEKRRTEDQKHRSPRENQTSLGP
jgi:hypothetical protein